MTELVTFFGNFLPSLCMNHLFNLYFCLFLEVKTVDKAAVGDSSTTRSSLLKKDAQSAQSAAVKYHSNNAVIKPSTKI